MTRVLLTGATGFVGSKVLKTLLKQGASVTAVTRRKKPGLPAGVAPVFTKDLFSEPRNFWVQKLADTDIVIHCAWYCEHSDYLTSAKNNKCLTGTLTLAEAALEAKVSKFVGVGTCFEYRMQDRPLDIDDLLDPQTVYGAAKAAAYLALSRAFENSETEFAWCRLFYLYGEGEDRRRLLPLLRSSLSKGQQVALGSGSQVRDFSDVSDIGAQIASVGLGSARGALNLCSGKGVTVAAIALEIANRYGRPDLVKLGARTDRKNDPAYVVGRPSLAFNGND